MVFEIIENIVLGVFIGFIAGIITTRYLFAPNTEKNNISRVIDCALIQKNISQLEYKSTELSQILAVIKEESEELSEKIKLAQDLEAYLEPLPEQNILSESRSSDSLPSIETTSPNQANSYPENKKINNNKIE